MNAIAKRPQPAHRLTRHMPAQKHDPGTVRKLAAGHQAIMNKTTVYPSTITHADQSPKLLISGINSRKIGLRVTKGRWKTLPIYTLTLVERATCPSNCSNWDSCYGNNMHYARRHEAGPALESKIAAELGELAEKHPRGFVVRLHVLGDFYSKAYVRFWALQMHRHVKMRLFGFTAHHSDSEIGAAIEFMNWMYKDRSFIRFSKGNTPDPKARLTAETVWKTPTHPTQANGGTICPVQTGRTDCCGTCTLCWSPHAKHIVFIGHGQKMGSREKKELA